MSYGRAISDGNGDSVGTSLEGSNNLSAQVAGYTPAERATAYGSMSPGGGEQYLPNVLIGNGQNTDGSTSAQGSTGNENQWQIPNGGGGGENQWQKQYGGGGGENQWQNQDGGGGGDNQWQNQWNHPRPEPNPPEPTPSPEPTPQPTVPTLQQQEQQQINQGVTQIDNSVQTGSIATGYSDMTQLLTQWKSQEPNDASSMESQLMQQLETTSTSDGMSGNDVIKDLGVNEVAALFPLFSSGGDVTAASLIADSDANSDPANKALIGGAAQWMEQAGMTSGVSNSVFFDGDIANGATNQQQYQNWLDQPKPQPNYATPVEQDSSSASGNAVLS